MAFMNFPDLLGEGNLAGIYVGQPPKITSSDLPTGRNRPSFVNRGDFSASEGDQPDTTLHLEGFYRIRVTDNISVTPGVIVILNPNHKDNNDNITIGALRTTFTF
jgi:carbohydrate-selective porin OprB